MIPLKLTIKGIYSYIEEQTIDFEQLTDSKLFGIFGSVGSGKSTILEAITFALYNDTERLNSRDSRAYNMMNLKSNEMLIDFEFYTESVDVKYRFTVKSKRNKNKFEDVSLKERSTLISENGNDWTPTDKAAEEIIGLSYKNFKRTIIIPQGKFKEFLELGAKDRTEMLNEIFNLQKFDLAPKLGTIKKENDDAIILLEGEMKQYQELTKESLDELNTKKKETLIKEEEESKLVKELRLKIEEQQKLENLFSELRKVKEKLETLNDSKANFDKKKLEVENYSYSKMNFDSYLKAFAKLEQNIKDDNNKLEQLKGSIENTEKEKSKIENEIKSIQQEYNNIEISKKQSEELNVIVSIRELICETEETSKRVEKGNGIVESENKKLNKIQVEIKKIKDELLILKSNQPNISELYKIKTYHEKTTAIEREKADLTKEISDNKLEISSLNKEVKNTVGDDLYSKNIDEIKERIGVKIDSLEKQKSDLDKETQDILAQQKLKHWADNLHNGESCPVCGATDHPNILNIADLQKDVLNISNEIEKVNSKLSVLRNMQTSLSGLSAKLQSAEKQLNTSIRKFTERNIEQESQIKTFVWGKYVNSSIDDITKQIKDSEIVNNRITQLEKTVNENELNEKTITKNVEKYNNAVLDFRNKVLELSTQVKSKTESLTLLKLIDFSTKSKEDISAIAKEKLSRAKFINDTFDKFTLYKGEKENKLAEASGIKKQLEETLEKNKNELYEIKLNIEETLKKSKYNSLEEVENILSNEINTQQVTKEIDEFFNQLQVASNELKRLNSKSEGEIFDKANLEKDTETIKIKEADLKKTTSHLSVITSEIKKLEADLKKKNDLEKKNENLLKRKENISLLYNLFKAKGFVNYISTVYLQNLSESANDRFFKMTKQHLQLEITDGNEFQIRDYLNEGKIRSVKTLSGGQIFQVSLSLALALADSVQNQIKANNNFFFLDEGFGSLDDEALHIVFETLKSLKNENRIVGVISHVESLKQEIDVHLQVVRNEERGSLVKYSWD